MVESLPNGTPWERGGTLHRSFSAFPDGRPGQGLLLLRLTVGLPLVYWGVLDLAAFHLSAIPELAAAIAGILLILGLRTTLAGVVVTVAEAGTVLWPTFAHADPWTRVLLAALGASVAMLGPGAWSVDARRFGRKVFEIGGSRDRPR